MSGSRPALCVAVGLFVFVFVQRGWSPPPTALPHTAQVPAPPLESPVPVSVSVPTRQTAELLRTQRPTASTPIDLNVGGQHYTITIDTLTRFNDSLLFRMFSRSRSESESASPKSDVPYFIDRDGILFRYILNYLRAGDQMPLNGFWAAAPGGSVNSGEPNQKYHKTALNFEVAAEAQYYELNGLISLLNDPLLTCTLCGQLIRLSDATPYSVGPQSVTTPNGAWYSANVYAVRSQCLAAQQIINARVASEGRAPFGPPQLALHEFSP